MSASPPAGPSPSLADRLAWLLANVSDPHSGKLFSNLALAQRTEGRVGDSTIGRLLDGTITNPKIDTAYAIADAFQLPRTILLDDPHINGIFDLALRGDPKGQKMILEMRTLKAAADQGVFDLALRASTVATSNANAMQSLDAFLKIFEKNADLISPPDDE